MARTRGAYSTTAQAPMLARLWQSMRVLRRFTTADLIVTAEASDTAAQKFTKALAATGFIKLMAARVNGRPGSRDVFVLVRDSGPLPPIRRKDRSGVLDANTQVFYPAPEPAAPAAKGEARG